MDVKNQSPKNKNLELSHLIHNPSLEVLILDLQLAKDLQCGICLQILNDPRQCQNGHLFCFPCITSVEVY